MIRVELAKVFRRTRTWVIIAVFCALPLIAALLAAYAEVPPLPGVDGQFMAAAVDHGELYPLAAIALLVPTLFPVAVSVLGGETIAGEAADGTLRYLLLRPVSRTRLLIAKMISLIMFTLCTVVAVMVTALITGLALFGSSSGGITLPAAVTQQGDVVIEPLDLALRMLGVVAYVVIAMTGVATVALLVSTVTQSAVGATVTAMAVGTVSQVLTSLNAVGGAASFLPTRYFLAWTDLFRDPIVWHDLQRGVGLQLVVVLVTLGAAWANFATKDIN